MNSDIKDDAELLKIELEQNQVTFQKFGVRKIF